VFLKAPASRARKASIRPLWTNIRIFRPCLHCYPLGNKLAVASRRRRGRKCGRVHRLARKPETHATIEHRSAFAKFVPHTDELARVPSAEPIRRRTRRKPRRRRANSGPRCSSQLDFIILERHL
jgi:hypothetical protein